MHAEAEQKRFSQNPCLVTLGSRGVRDAYLPTPLTQKLVTFWSKTGILYQKPVNFQPNSVIKLVAFIMVENVK